MNEVGFCNRWRCYLLLSYCENLVGGFLNHKTAWERFMECNDEDKWVSTQSKFKRLFKRVTVLEMRLKKIDGVSRAPLSKKELNDVK